MRVAARLLPLFLGGWPGSVALGQEPPAPGEGGGEEQQQETQQEEQEPPPAPETQDPEQGPPPQPPESEGAAPPGGDLAAPAGEPAPQPSHPAVAWPLTSEGIAQHMRGIESAHPSVAALELLGRSAAGREILCLRLTARGDGALERPVLLLADYQGVGSAGPEACLELAWRLAEDFERDELVRALLSRAALVIAPALDPDARAGGSERSRGVRFERNFPSGWQPDTVREGSGRVSLSEPETLATARFLAGLKPCGVVLGFAPSAPRGEPYPGAELPASDLEVFARLVAALELEGVAPLVPWFELGSSGGGLFDFAYQARGIYPFAIQLPAEEELAAGNLPAFAGQVGARALRCLALLPHVEIVQEGLERLASDTWQLDVRIQNVGVVPTLSALARHREPGADVALSLDGAKLVATAKKPESGAAYTDASFRVRAPLSGGTLAGGEGRWLRLILEGGSGAEVRVTAGSLWAGKDELAVVLP